MKQLLVIIPLIALSACVPESDTRKAENTQNQVQIDTQAQQAQTLYDNGDFTNAVALLENLSNRAAPEGWHWRLLTADAYLQLGNTEKARSLISTLADKQLSSDDLLLLALIEAGIDLQSFAPANALAVLKRTYLTTNVQTLQKRYYQLLAEAYRLSGNLLESANALQQLDVVLLDSQARLDNQLAIIRTLSMMSDTALEMMQPSPPGTLSGWMELTRLIKLYGQSMEEIQPYLDIWQQQFVQHPAMPELLGGYFQKLEAQYQQARHIAVLLPEQGRYAPAAEALKNGLMAAWYASPADKRPQLSFYDSSDIQKTWPVYVEAMERGADFVIGPLQKEAVSQLLNAGELPVPVLALNQVGIDTIPPANFYQYSLSPEDEARQVAERAWLDGKRQPILLKPVGEWGDRIADSFTNRWLELGGQITETQSYEASQNDFSDPIKALLDIDQSYSRKTRLQNLFGEKLDFEPRRREDTDFVFVIANAGKARQIRPQLQFHHALGLPIYTTSHAWAGYMDANTDRDIDGIIFPDIPWLLTGSGNAGLDAEQLIDMLDLQQSPLLRLTAMGIDSYLLIAHLSRLQVIDSETFAGQTGQLYMDSMQNLHRQLVWAQMKNMRLEVLGYAPRITAMNFPAAPQAIEDMTEQDTSAAQTQPLR